jgi:hypothetical protein
LNKGNETIYTVNGIKPVIKKNPSLEGVENLILLIAVVSIPIVKDWGIVIPQQLPGQFVSIEIPILSNLAIC